MEATLARTSLGVLVALLHLLAGAQSQYGQLPSYPGFPYGLYNYTFNPTPAYNPAMANYSSSSATYPYYYDPYLLNPYQSSQYNPYLANPYQYYPNYSAYTTTSPHYPYGGYAPSPTFAPLTNGYSGYGAYGGYQGSSNNNNKIRIWPFIIGGSYGSYLQPTLLSYLFNQTAWSNNYG